jgi:hypothetical protein
MRSNRQVVEHIADVPGVVLLQLPSSAEQFPPPTAISVFQTRKKVEY